MTSTEQENIKGQTVDSLSESRRKLACLEAKADKIRKGLRYQIKAISNAIGQAHGSETSAALGHDEWPNLSDIQALLVEIRQTKDEIEICTTRLREWGAID